MLMHPFLFVIREERWNLHFKPTTDEMRFVFCISNRKGFYFVISENMRVGGIHIYEGGSRFIHSKLSILYRKKCAL